MPTRIRRREVKPPRATEEGPDPRAERRSRALTEPLDIHPRSDHPFVALEVRNPTHRTHYLVVVPGAPSLEGALCQCSDFARRGLGTCKHLEAVRLWLGEHPTPIPAAPAGLREWAAPLWSEVDRRIAWLSHDRGPWALRVRGPGDVLVRDGPKGRGPRVVPLR